MSFSLWKYWSIAFFGDFWNFVKSGGYSYEKSDGGKQFYRFRKPSAPGFPYQIELFARKTGTIELPRCEDHADSGRRGCFQSFGRTA